LIDVLGMSTLATGFCGVISLGGLVLLGIAVTVGVAKGELDPNKPRVIEILGNLYVLPTLFLFCTLFRFTLYYPKVTLLLLLLLHKDTFAYFWRYKDIHRNLIHYKLINTGKIKCVILQGRLATSSLRKLLLLFFEKLHNRI
jgi:hypothetical protein